MWRGTWRRLFSPNAALAAKKESSRNWWLTGLVLASPVMPALLVSFADLLGLWDAPDGVLAVCVYAGLGVSALLAVWATIKFRPQ